MNDERRLMTPEEHEKAFYKFLKAWSDKNQVVAYDTAAAVGRYDEQKLIFDWLEINLGRFLLGETKLTAKEAYRFSTEFVKAARHHLG